VQATSLYILSPDFCVFLQAAEKGLQELKASMKQSQSDTVQVAGLQEELEKTKAALQASQEAVKVSDAEKVHVPELRPVNQTSSADPSVHVAQCLACHLLTPPFASKYTVDM